MCYGLLVTTTQQAPSHIPPLSKSDQAELDQMPADTDEEFTAFAAFHQEAKIRACLRVSHKLEWMILDGQAENADQAAGWSASAASLRAMAEWIPANL